jgi:hypothetical protein
MTQPYRAASSVDLYGACESFNIINRHSYPIAEVHVCHVRISQNMGAAAIPLPSVPRDLDNLPPPDLHKSTVDAAGLNKTQGSP